MPKEQLNANQVSALVVFYTKNYPEPKDGSWVSFEEFKKKCKEDNSPEPTKEDYVEVYLKANKCALEAIQNEDISRVFDEIPADIIFSDPNEATRQFNEILEEATEIKNAIEMNERSGFEKVEAKLKRTFAKTKSDTKAEVLSFFEQKAIEKHIPPSQVLVGKISKLTTPLREIIIDNENGQLKSRFSKILNPKNEQKNNAQLNSKLKVACLGTSYAKLISSVNPESEDGALFSFVASPSVAAIKKNIDERANLVELCSQLKVHLDNGDRALEGVVNLLGISKESFDPWNLTSEQLSKINQLSPDKKLLLGEWLKEAGKEFIAVANMEEQIQKEAARPNATELPFNVTNKLKEFKNDFNKITPDRATNDLVQELNDKSKIRWLVEQLKELESHKVNELELAKISEILTKANNLDNEIRKLIGNDIELPKEMQGIRDNLPEFKQSLEKRELELKKAQKAQEVKTKQEQIKKPKQEQTERDKKPKQEQIEKIRREEELVKLEQEKIAERNEVEKIRLQQESELQGRVEAKLKELNKKPETKPIFQSEKEEVEKDEVTVKVSEWSSPLQTNSELKRKQEDIQNSTTIKEQPSSQNTNDLTLKKVVGGVVVNTTQNSKQEKLINELNAVRDQLKVCRDPSIYIDLMNEKINICEKGGKSIPELKKGYAFRSNLSKEFKKDIRQKLDNYLGNMNEKDKEKKMDLIRKIASKEDIDDPVVDYYVTLLKKERPTFFNRKGVCKTYSDNTRSYKKLVSDYKETLEYAKKKEEKVARL